MSNARLVAENMLIFVLGLGLLPILGVAPTVARFRRIWPVGYLAGLAAVGIVAATLAVLSVPFPPLALVAGAAIWGLLRDRVRPAVGWPFLAAIATAPTVFTQLASGYADMPMAFFLAGGLLAGGRWLLEPDGSWLVLASLLLAAAAVSKDEGDLFVAAAYVGLVVAASGRRAHGLLSAAAVACVLIPWRVFLAVHHFSTSDFGGLLWIYVISWIPLDLYLAQTEDRITAGVILGCAALAPPLLAEACARPSMRTDPLSGVPSGERQTRIARPVPDEGR